MNDKKISHDVDMATTIDSMVIVNFNRMALDDMLEDIGVYTQKHISDSCPTCYATEFIDYDHSKGEVRCRCGQVIDNMVDDGAERRYFDDDVGAARCTITQNKLLPQSSMGTSVHVSGKLRKLQIWCGMPYKERSDNQLYKKIDTACTENNIPGMVKYDAQLICKKVSSKSHTKGDNIGKPIITRGRNREGIVSGCLYISCRKNSYTRSAREIAHYFGIKEANVNGGVASIQSILKNDPIIRDLGTSKVTDFIKRKCDELRIRNVDASRAVTIGKNIERLGIASNHTTYALAAAAILLMADINELVHVNKKLLSEHFSNLTDVTIGKTYNQIQNKREVLINDAVTDEIIRRVDEKKKRRSITKEIADKMIQFGINTSKYAVEGEGDEHANIDITVSLDIHTSDGLPLDASKYNNYNSDNMADNMADNMEGLSMITMEDIKDIIEEIKSRINVMNTSDIDTEGNLYKKFEIEIMNNREMITEFVQEYPETLDQKDIDIEFFMNVICTSSEIADEITKLRNEVNEV
jgi:transcription initiation factor TFIIIB Brf1 subunit/transcription initiation factor TFIIB